MSNPPYSTARLQHWRSQDLEPSFVSTLDNIEKFGWQAMLVSSKEQPRSFAYTIGLFDVFGFPELITTGLALKVAHSALNYAVELMKTGVDLTKGRHSDIVGDVEVIFRPVSPNWYRETMYRADWYYEKAEVPALQLVYPDLQNRLPWDEGFNEYFRQPMLAPDAIEGPTEHQFRTEDKSVKDWKFPVSRHTNAYLSKTVFDKEESVTYVSHDDNGDWQFLGDKMSEGGGPIISCLHHPIDDDPSLEKLYDLPLSWYATRETADAPWQRFEHPPEDPSDEDSSEPPKPPLLN